METTMTEPTTAQRVIAALVAPSGFKADEIEPQHTLRGDLRMDSLDIVEAVIAIEDACSVELPDFEAEFAQTVADLIALVESKRGAA